MSSYLHICNAASSKCIEFGSKFSIVIVNSFNKKHCLIYIRSGLYLFFHLLSNQKYFGFRSNCQSKSVVIVTYFGKQKHINALSALIQGRLFVTIHYHLEVQGNPKKCKKKPNAIFSIYGRNGIIP